MWKPKCPFHIMCKYFSHQTKIVYFRVKVRFLDFVNKHCSMDGRISCAARGTQNFCKLQEFLFHMHALVHSFSLDFKPHDFNIKLFMCPHFRNFLRRMIETRECSLTKRNLVCSMITISENAAPKTILVMDPQCSCEKQEYQDFYSITVVICDTSMISANVRVLLKRDIFRLVLNILTQHLVISIPNWSLFQSPKITKFYPEHRRQ